LSSLDDVDASNPCQPDEKDGKKRRMKPLLFKNQLNLRHAALFQDVALELAIHGREVPTGTHKQREKRQLFLSTFMQMLCGFS
jgi:hypothetical protein